MTIYYAPTAKAGGALSILKEFYIKACDESEHAIFFVSKGLLKPTKNIVVIDIADSKFPKLISLFYRWLKFIEIQFKYKADKLISFTNFKLILFRGKQFLYLHQILPFVDIKISLFNEPSLWLRKYILGFFIKLSVFNSKNIIVQSDHFRFTLTNKYPFLGTKIEIIKPTLRRLSKYKKPLIIDDEKKITFFYPASNHSYKNHKILLDAVRFIDPKLYPLFKINLTCELSKRYRKLIESLDTDSNPFVELGVKNESQIKEYYMSGIVINVSLVESYGLTLDEAIYFNRKLISIDLPYAREVVQDYEKIRWVNDYKTLARAILNELNDR